MKERKSVVLVVDDQPVQLKILLPCLEKAGYEVILVEDGEGALSLLQTESVDIILLKLEDL